MKIGITAYGQTAPDLLAMAAAADDVGFHSLWVGEHLVAPVGYESPHPTSREGYQPRPKGAVVALDTPLTDPLVSLAAIAAATSRLELGTAIYLLALRHPLLTARAASTLQDLAGGRLYLGVGTGWLEEEFGAFGVPFAERVKRFDDAVDVLRKAWAGGPFEHDSPFVSTGGSVQVSPEPTQVPIVFGGNTERALDRAARMADGWFASGMPPLEDFLRMRDRIEALRGQHGRTGSFRYWIRAETWDPAFLARYEAEGVDEVLVWARSPYPTTEENELWPAGSIEQRRARVAEVGRALGLEPRGVVSP
jgi:probable F420-dependent oxidoreductase